ncbi:Two-component response regulator ARR22 [Euphorbia peplus]|nr:Two-component response regulator ARR22 [Euphorbia peplus]
MGYETGTWCSESSNVRKGSTFYEDEDGNKDTSNGRISVLIVDDEINTRKLNELLLTLSGLEVQGVDNGKQAIELHSIGNTFDLILMDNEMPLKNGYEATKELRNMGVRGAIVGVVSMDEDEDVINNFLKAGLDDCIKKPLTLDKIEPFIIEKPYYTDYLSDDDVISTCSSTNSNVIN